jgi:hypothetical protein
MKYSFSPDIPRESLSKPVLISGIDSSNHKAEYLSIIKDDGQEFLAEIRSECRNGVFREAILINNILAVGCHDYFYLFDIAQSKNIISYKVADFFGHVYHDENLFYFSDYTGLYCIDFNGDIIWHKTNLAIDGVIIESFSFDKIYCAGEWDPPGGWVKFVLDKKTGLKLSGI